MKQMGRLCRKEIPSKIIIPMSNWIAKKKLIYGRKLIDSKFTYLIAVMSNK
jgi:hypothetical protein